MGERRASGETRYYLANLPAETGLGRLVAVIKARWLITAANRRGIDAIRRNKMRERKHEEITLGLDGAFGGACRHASGRTAPSCR